MGPKKDTASTSKASKAPDKKKDRKFDSCVMYFPRKKQRDDSGLFMFDLMHWIEITKHPSFPTPPGRILRDRKLEDHDRLREYTIPYFLGKQRFDMKAHIFAIVEKGYNKKAMDELCEQREREIESGMTYQQLVQKYDGRLIVDYLQAERPVDGSDPLYVRHDMGTTRKQPERAQTATELEEEEELEEASEEETTTKKSTKAKTTTRGRSASKKTPARETNPKDTDKQPRSASRGKGKGAATKTPGKEPPKDPSPEPSTSQLRRKGVSQGPGKKAVPKKRQAPTHEDDPSSDEEDDDDQPPGPERVPSGPRTLTIEEREELLKQERAAFEKERLEFEARRHLYGHDPPVPTGEEATPQQGRKYLTIEDVEAAIAKALAPLAKVFEDKFATKTPERLQAKPHSYKDMVAAAAQEVASEFPTSNPGDVHSFFYRDPYRFAAMVDRLMAYEPDKDFLRKCFRAFYSESALSGLLYPEEWFSRNVEDLYGPLINREGYVAGVCLKIIVTACEKAGVIGEHLFPTKNVLLMKMRKTMDNLGRGTDDRAARAAFPPGTSSQTQEDSQYAQDKKLQTLQKRERDRLRKQKQRDRDRDKKKQKKKGDESDGDEEPKRPQEVGDDDDDPDTASQTPDEQEGDAPGHGAEDRASKATPTRSRRPRAEDTSTSGPRSSGLSADDGDDDDEFPMPGSRQGRTRTRAKEKGQEPASLPRRSPRKPKKRLSESEDAGSRVRKSARGSQYEKDTSEEYTSSPDGRKRSGKKERDAKEKASKDRAEKEQAEKEQAKKQRAEQERAEKERAEQERAEKERAEQERAEQERAEQERAEQERAEQERAEKERAEQEEKEQAEREKAKKREEHNKKVIEGKIKISAKSSIKEAEERRRLKEQTESEKDAEVLRREAVSAAEVVIETHQTVTEGGTLTDEEVEMSLGGPPEDVDDPLNTGLLEPPTGAGTSSSEQEKTKPKRPRALDFMETDEGEDVPPGPSQGGEEGAPTTGDEGSTGQDPQAPAPQGEGEKGKGSEEKKKYDDEKFIKQREAFLAAAIPGGRERLKEMAKRAPEKPKKGSVKSRLRDNRPPHLQPQFEEFHDATPGSTPPQEHQPPPGYMNVPVTMQPPPQFVIQPSQPLPPPPPGLGYPPGSFVTLAPPYQQAPSPYPQVGSPYPQVGSPWLPPGPHPQQPAGQPIQQGIATPPPPQMFIPPPPGHQLPARPPAQAPGQVARPGFGGHAPPLGGPQQPGVHAGVHMTMRGPSPGQHVEAAAVAEGRAIMQAGPPPQRHPLPALHPNVQQQITGFLYPGSQPPSQYPSPSVSIRSGSEEMEFDTEGRPIYIRQPSEPPGRKGEQ